jgi:hypothetical protein
VSVTCGVDTVATAEIVFDDNAPRLGFIAVSQDPLGADLGLTGTALGRTDEIYFEVLDLRSPCRAPRITVDGNPAQIREIDRAPWLADTWAIYAAADRPPTAERGQVHMVSLYCDDAVGIREPISTYPWVGFQISGPGGTPPSSSGAGSSTGAAPGGSTQSVVFHQSPVFLAVPRPTDIQMGLASILRSAAVTIALILLIGFPAELFNKTLEENAEEVRGWFRPLLRITRVFGTASPDGAQRRRWTADLLWATPRRRLAAFCLLAALLMSFADPTIGLDGKTAVLVVALAVGVAVITLVYARTADLVSARLARAGSTLKVLPICLVFATSCAILSRTLSFLPAYVYGLVASYVATRKLTRAQEGRGVLVAAICTLAVALLAWVGLERIHPLGSQADAGVVARLADAVLASIFILGVQTIVFGLVPVRYLDGDKLRGWSRVAWVGVYTAGMFLFVHVLVFNRQNVRSEGGVSGFFSTLELFLGFGALSVLFWAYFRYRPSRQDPAARQEEAVEG